MKLLKCIVRPEKLDDLLTALQGVVAGMTVSEVRGHGRQKGHVVAYRGVEYAVTLLPKVMVEIVVEDNRVEDVVGAITKIARTGVIGDGRIYIQTVEEAYHIRTGFMNTD
jgi:nitrogen regulatory protein PII